MPLQNSAYFGRAHKCIPVIIQNTLPWNEVFKVHDDLLSETSWGAFDLPESESGFEIMILIHRFI